MKVAIIGGGAAGFFAAFSVKKHHPDATVCIYEKSAKVLSKVKVSGGGRCNVCNSCTEISKLIKNYPRGEKFLKKAFHQFQTKDTIDWFQKRGVKLKEETDQRMFPESNDSQTIIDCFLKEKSKLNIDLKLKSPVQDLKALPNGTFQFNVNGKTTQVDKVIVAFGGSPMLKGFEILSKLQINIIEPIPSLFTFNMTTEPIKALMGVSVSDVDCSIVGTKLKSSGPLLITHWGMSGPAILKLSAFGAIDLHKMNYDFSVRVNWMKIASETEAKKELRSWFENSLGKQIGNCPPIFLSKRLWHFLLEASEIPIEKPIKELGSKQENRLINTLINSQFKVKGKTTFKEEFVTAGGVDLNEIDSHTMQHKTISNLYFAGEVLNIDAVTGGFNFQAAWTTGFIAGKIV
ncbi:MAG: putative Rossmann fold flavoprotein [Sphingobacteriales bacterium]|jgi:predicted Rossmann fold flavoprotein